ncbi:hypothetical protein EON81_01790 [bacterium]|nr:MAG: hypothetical protein EON81_01790 [bacterium]
MMHTEDEDLEYDMEGYCPSDEELAVLYAPLLKKAEAFDKASRRSGEVVLTSEQPRKDAAKVR